jgi:hypothetical protein
MHRSHYLSDSAELFGASRQHSFRSWPAMGSCFDLTATRRIALQTSDFGRSGPSGRKLTNRKALEKALEVASGPGKKLLRIAKEVFRYVADPL